MVSFYRRCALGLLAVPFALALAPRPALAAKTPVSLRLGWDTLVDGDARDLTNSSGLAAGLSFDLPQTPVTSGMGRIDLDYMRHSGNGNRIEKESLFYVHRIGFSRARSLVGMPYAGLGVGLARVKGRARIPVVLPGGGSNDGGGTDNGEGGGVFTGTGDLLPLQTPGFTTQSTTKTRVALKALLGYELPSGMYGEAAYTYSGKVQGVRTDSFNVSVGVPLLIPTRLR